MIQVLSLIIPTLILAVAVVEDLRSKKVSNKLVIGMVVVAFVTAVAFDGWRSIPWSLLSFSTAFFLGFPLFAMGILGAGDVKVFMAFAILLSWEAVVFVGAYSIIWGAALGVARSLLSGHGKTLALNTWGILRYQKRPTQSELSFVPYTVALLFGWMTYLAQAQPNFWGFQ